MASWPILSITTFLPLVGVLFIAMLPRDSEAGKRNARWVALWTTLVTFAVSLVLLQRFDVSTADFQFIEKQPWLGGAINYHMGVNHRTVSTATWKSRSREIPTFRTTGPHHLGQEKKKNRTAIKR